MSGRLFSVYLKSRQTESVSSTVEIFTVGQFSSGYRNFLGNLRLESGLTVRRVFGGVHAVKWKALAEARAVIDADAPEKMDIVPEALLERELAAKDDELMVLSEQLQTSQMEIKVGGSQLGRRNEGLQLELGRLKKGLAEAEARAEAMTLENARLQRLADDVGGRPVHCHALHID